MAASAAFQHRGSSDRLLDSSNGPGPPSSSSLTLSMNMEAIKDSSIGGMDQHPTPRTIATNKRHAMYALSSMTLLTLQGTVLSIVLRYSRIKEGRKYIPSVAGTNPSHLLHKLTLVPLQSLDIPLSCLSSLVSLTNSYFFTTQYLYLKPSNWPFA